MFEGFTLDRIDVGDAVLRVRHGGSGPPVLLLHGHPRTHATWNKVAPLLAERFTVVCPDLRGYGESSKPAERFISADPQGWYTATAEHMGAEAYQDYRRAIHNPDTVHAMMEDYRAGLGIDRQHDEADRTAGRRIGCPLLYLWAKQDDMEDLYGDPLAIWRDWADDVRGQSVDCGHHIAEEAPAELATLLTAFFA